MALNDGMLVVEVGKNNYYLPYSVRVGAVNDIGEGPISPEVRIFSAEGSKCTCSVFVATLIFYRIISLMSSCFLIRLHKYIVKRHTCIVFMDVNHKHNVHVIKT